MLHHQIDTQFTPYLNFGNPLNYQGFSQPTEATNKGMKCEATLRITEQPVEKFIFPYKSEMHGTHASLNGTNSQRNTNSFPEVELCVYKCAAIIRCNLESPHSRQLVIRKDDHDICDPHELKVSQEDGYYAEFKNMGIIHAAKKFIVEKNFLKKRKRLLFELGRDALTLKEEQDLFKQTEKEVKDMNLNQVRTYVKCVYRYQYIWLEICFVLKNMDNVYKDKVPTLLYTTVQINNEDQ